mgnify:FL=1
MCSSDLGLVASCAVVRKSIPPSPCRPGPFVSEVRGLDHDASATVLRLLSLFPAGLFPFCAGAPAIGVGQCVKCAIAPNWIVLRVNSAGEPCSLALCATGVGHEVQSLSDVRRADARSAEIKSPEGVTRCFHVRLNKVEPTEAVLARNLLSKDCWRAALANEVKPRWPEVPLIINPCSFACRAERLARTGSGPDGAVIGPSGSTQGVGPDADPCEEVALSKFKKFIWYDIFNAPFIDFARRDVALFDKFAQPCSRLGVVFIIIRRHSITPMFFSPSRARVMYLLKSTSPGNVAGSVITGRAPSVLGTLFLFLA